MSHPKHAHVRERYQRRCGYCGVHENEAGGELTVDHHRPLSAGGGEDDDNLVYCCFRCNSYKGEFFPNSADTNCGFRVLHPLRDPISEHISEEKAGTLEPISETGHFHIALLRLNRPQLVDQ